MNKTVWRINTKHTIPNDLGDRLMIASGTVRNTRKGCLGFGDLKNHRWGIWNHNSDIHAYQTNRTKPAKYFSSVCEECMGYGCEIDWYNESCPPIDGTTCYSCEGRKRHLSKIE